MARRAVVDPAFAGMLAELRARAGLSLSQAAAVCHVTRGHISNLERGVKSPTEATARALDTGLRADGRLAALVTEVEPDHPSGTDTGCRLPDGHVPMWADVGWQVSLAGLGQPGELGKLPMRKPVTAAMHWSDVENVRFITRMFATTENMYGGGFSGEAAAAQLRHSASLLEARASDDVRRALFEAVGNLSEVVGFVAFDIADYTSAQCHVA